MITIQTMWRNHIVEHKNLFIAIAIGLFLLELEIFALAIAKSGRESHLQISNAEGRVIYAVNGDRISAEQKVDFERTFGPLTAHRVELVVDDRPFPLRPWLAAAVGLPVGAALLFAFFAKAYEVLFIRSDATRSAATGAENPAVGPLDRLLTRIGRLNIFIVGALVFLLAFGIWALPQLLAELGRFGAETIARYKWAVLGIVAVFLAVVLWIIYLRYLLARKSIEGQIEVEKYRLQLETNARQNLLSPSAAAALPSATSRLRLENLPPNCSDTSCEK